MTSVLKDILVLLHRAEEVRDEVGLGKNEIHPVANRLKRETEDALFADATFRSGYRGVRSPEIRQVLSLFTYGDDYEIFTNDGRVIHSDEYYRLTIDRDIELARERWTELDSDVQSKIDAIIEELSDSDSRLDLIRNENEKIEEWGQTSVS